jgi:hypothetical protein
MMPHSLFGFNRAVNVLPVAGPGAGRLYSPLRAGVFRTAFLGPHCAVPMMPQVVACRPAVH